MSEQPYSSDNNTPPNDSIKDANSDQNQTAENNFKHFNRDSTSEEVAKPSSSIDNNSSNSQQFIKVIDIDDLPYPELLRITTATGSKNIAYYLALIVNLENRSRKLSPQLSAKVLSSRSISAPASHPKAVEVVIESAINNNLQK